MVSTQSLQATSKSMDPPSSPRISFSSEFLDENNFISIHPNTNAPDQDNKKEQETKRTARTAADQFEFLSGDLTNMITADELFCEGKLLPFWQMHHAEKLNKITLKTGEVKQGSDETGEKDKEQGRINWFIDDDPSPRPPKCTVLWKELLRLKKNRPTTLLTSSSSSSSSSSRSSGLEVSTDDQRKNGILNREKAVKRIKKGLERTRSASIRIRPVINVPICTHTKNSAMPPMFSLKKGRLEVRVKNKGDNNNNNNVEK